MPAAAAAKSKSVANAIASLRAYSQTQTQTQTQTGRNSLKLKLDDASAAIHIAWMARNPKEDYNKDQHVPYNELPETEKEKDRAQARVVIQALRDGGYANVDALVDGIGSKLHEAWMENYVSNPNNPDVRMKPIKEIDPNIEGENAAKQKIDTDKKPVFDAAGNPVLETNILVPWNLVHKDYKVENLNAARAAYYAVKHFFQADDIAQFNATGGRRRAASRNKGKNSNSSSSKGKSKSSKKGPHHDDDDERRGIVRWSATGRRVTCRDGVVRTEYAQGRARAVRRMGKNGQMRYEQL